MRGFVLQRDGKSSAVTILQEAPARRVHDPEIRQPQGWHAGDLSSGTTNRPYN